MPLVRVLWPRAVPRLATSSFLTMTISSSWMLRYAASSTTFPFPFPLVHLGRRCGSRNRGGSVADDHGGEPLHARQEGKSSIAYALPTMAPRVDSRMLLMCAEAFLPGGVLLRATGCVMLGCFDLFALPCSDHS